MASSRPKGYMDWKPQPHVAEVVAQAKEVLAEYARFGPMTVRQIFYRLVGNYGYPKDEKAYNRLAEYLVKARRAQMISFDRIRDDGGTTAGGSYGFESIDSFLEDLADYAGAYRRDPTEGQPAVIELWCEAEGMVPMLSQMTRHYGVAVTGTGGFSSVTVTHGFARRVLGRDKPTVLLHVGDFDPSGESIFESMCQDIGAFVVGAEGGTWRSHTGEVLELGDGRKNWFVPRRVALTAEQVNEYDLPTAPPKRSDSRSANWIGETTQAEAMPPDLLEEVVVAAVEEHIDQDQRTEILEREAHEREIIGTRASDAIDTIRREIEDEG